MDQLPLEIQLMVWVAELENLVQARLINKQTHTLTQKDFRGYLVELYQSYGRKICNEEIFEYSRTKDMVMVSVRPNYHISVELFCKTGKKSWSDLRPVYDDLSIQDTIEKSTDALYAVDILSAYNIFSARSEAAILRKIGQGYVKQPIISWLKSLKQRGEKMPVTSSPIWWHRRI